MENSKLNDVMSSLNENSSPMAKEIRKFIMGHMDDMIYPEKIFEVMATMAADYNWVASARVGDWIVIIHDNIRNMANINEWHALLHIPNSVRKAISNMEDIPSIILETVKLETDFAELPLAEKKRLMSMTKKE